MNPFCGEKRGEGRERKKERRGREERERREGGESSGRKGGLEKRSNERWDSWEFCIKLSKLFDTCALKGCFPYIFMSRAHKNGKLE